MLLGGELGAGKTTFTQGLAAELGVAEPVTSPTFVLVHSYKTAAGWDLLHADVWRLEHLQEVIDLALPELLEDGAAAVIEWGEIAAPALAPDWFTWPSVRHHRLLGAEPEQRTNRARPGVARGLGRASRRWASSGGPGQRRAQTLARTGWPELSTTRPGRPLKILAIETATPCVGCALWADGGPVASFMLVAASAMPRSSCRLSTSCAGRRGGRWPT